MFEFRINSFHQITLRLLMQELCIAYNFERHYWECKPLKVSFKMSKPSNLFLHCQFVSGKFCSIVGPSQGLFQKEKNMANMGLGYKFVNKWCRPRNYIYGYSLQPISFCTQDVRLCGQTARSVSLLKAPQTITITCMLRVCCLYVTCMLSVCSKVSAVFISWI
jgi:hypothetical protein